MRWRWESLAAVLVSVAVLLLLAPAEAMASGRCSLAGTWTGTNDAGLTFIITFDPLDSAHKRFSTLADGPDDPSVGGLFPTAVDGTVFQGEAKRTGRRSFDQTALAYVRDNSGWIGTFAVSGSWVTSEDCRTAEVVWYAGAFFAGEDPLVDEPFFCFPPIVGTYERLPIVTSSCEP